MRPTALALLLLALAGPARPDCAGIVLPLMDGADGQPRIAVGLPDGARRFVLDTGAPVSVLRESVVAELGLAHQPINLDAVAGATGRAFQERVVVPQVVLGGAVFDDVGFLIQPRSHAANADMAGLIGADLFARYDLELDYARHRIVLLPQGACRPPGMAALTVEIRRSRHVLVPLVADGQRIAGLLDTGAAESLMKMDAAHRFFGVDPAEAQRLPAGLVAGADGGQMPAYLYGLRTLALGPVTLDRPHLLLITDQTRERHPLVAGAPDAETGLPDFVLGMSALRRLHLIVAYGEGRLYVAEAARGAG